MYGTIFRRNQDSFSGKNSPNSGRGQGRKRFGAGASSYNCCAITCSSMAQVKKKHNTLLFEELEPRLLFSADMGEALAAGAVEQEYVEEQVIITDLEPDLDAGNVAVDQPDEKVVVAGEDRKAIEVSETASSKELVFVGSNVHEYQQLIDDLQQWSDSENSIEVIILDDEQNGFEQVGEILGDRTDLTAVHFISHGADGQIKLGKSWLNTISLQQNSDAVAGWGESLAESGDILFYGCNIAAGSNGQSLLADIAELTGADVAASEDATGHADLGGDWELEFAAGRIESSIPFTENVSESWHNALATFLVTTTDDVVDGTDSYLSLREAIIAANIAPGTDEILLGTGTYRLTIGGVGEDGAATGDLDITSELTITGLGVGDTIIDGGGLDRVFDISATGNATISDLAIENGGNVTQGGGIQIIGGGGGGRLNLDNVAVRNNTAWTRGAGVYSDGVLGMDDVEISGNSGSAEGGGFYNTQEATLTGVTISGNSATHGAGIFNSNQGILMSLQNVTISGNTASGDGGGIYSARLVSATNATIAANLGGSGIYVTGGLGDVELKNSILANNTGGNSNDDLTSLGYNIDSDGTAGISDTGDISGTILSPIDVKLGTLQDNGGSTRTHALLVGSPAIDFGTATGAPATDQRGAMRDANPDIGAYEFAVSPLPTANPGGPYTIFEGDQLDLIGSGSSDSDGIIVSWEWDIGDNGTFEKSGETISYTWAELYLAGVIDDGTVDVSLRVTDNDANQATQTVQLTVDNTAPTLAATGTGLATLGSAYTLNLIASDPGDDTITTYTVNWGDGSITTEAFTGPTTPVIHIYTESGFTRNITFAATDEDGTWTASDLIVGSWISDGEEIFRIDGVTGDPDGVFNAPVGVLVEPYTAVVGPDGNYYVPGYKSNNIVRFDADGSYLGVFTAAAEFDIPTGLAWGADGNLYVANYGNDNILRFDTAGTFLDYWGGANSVLGPTDVAFGLDGDLYVTSYDDNKLVKFDAATGGTPTTVLASGLNNPEQMVFDSAGDLFIANGGNNDVVKWDGSSLTSYFSHTDLSWTSGVTFGPDGQLYVSSYDNDKILRYDGITGEVFADDGPGGFGGPTYLTFSPAHQVAVSATPNIPPTFTSFVGPVTSGNEDSEITITFGNLAVQGDEDDTDGTVDAFVIKSVSSGTLRLGSDAGSATAWAATTNDTLDAITNAYWTPDANVNGTVDAFAVVALDDDGAESAGNVTVQVTVNSINDIGTVTIDNINPIQGDTLLASVSDADGASGTISYQWQRDGADIVGAIMDNYTTIQADVGAKISVVASYTDDVGFNEKVSSNSTATVINVNDAPNLADDNPTLTVINEDDFTSIGDSVAAIVVDGSITDIDGAAVESIAITDIDDSNGVWQYSTDNGGTWDNVDDGSLAVEHALLLDGTLSGASTQKLRFLPTADYNGSATFVFKAWDQTSGSADTYVNTTGSGGSTAFSSATDTAIITINSINDEQVLATNTGITVAEGSSGTVLTAAMLTTNDVESIATELFYTLIAAPSYGTLYLSGTALADLDSFSQDDIDNGRVTYNHDGSETTNDNFSFSVDDGIGTASSDTFIITINPVNDNDPVADDESFSVAEGGTATESDLVAGTNLLDGDLDGDLPNDTLSVNTTPLSGPSHGSLTLNSDGTFSYTHNGSENFSDSFSYELLDADGGVTDSGTVMITISPIDDNDPVADDESFTVAEGGTATEVDLDAGSSLLDGDLDGDLPNDTLSVNTTQLSGPSHGSLTLNSDGTFSYTHNGSENFSDSFSYELLDADGGVTDSGMVMITISPINDNEQVLAVNTGRTVAEGSTGNTITAAMLATTDADNTADQLVYTLNASPSNGTLYLSGSALADTDSFTQDDIDTGKLSYDHDGSETTADSFDFSVDDGTGVASSDTFIITITPVNDNEQVLALNTGGTVAEGSTGNTITAAMLTTTDADNTADQLVYTLNTSPFNGTLFLSGSALVGTDTFTQDDIDTGRVSYDHDGSETMADSFSFSVDDGMGSASSGIFSFTVTAVNDAPLVADDSINTDAESVYIGMLPIASDIEGDTLTYSVESQASNGTAVVNGDGSFSYNPSAGWSGADSFTYIVTDSGGEVSSATVNVMVNPPINVEPENIIVDEEYIKPAGSDDSTAETTAPPVVNPVTPEKDNEKPTEDIADTSEGGSTTLDTGILFSGETMANVSVDVAHAVANGGETISANHGRMRQDINNRPSSTSLLLEKYLDQIRFNSDIEYATAFEQLREALDDFKQEAESDTQYYKTVVGSAIAVSTGLSVGYVAWLIRGGMLLSSVLFSMPAWQIADPLPLLAHRGDEENEEDEETLETIISAGSSSGKEKMGKK
ncbi:MAG: DUF4347 domain-containing protein [Desulfobulbaceae bacterium]|nr:DUF4347 domain-containing protein [Desulfobulbaceae bacterium]